MGSVYDGLASNISFPAALNIASSTNASPISITTSTPHLLQTGDQVTVNAHQTNTAANGANQTVTVTGGSTFTLNGSSGIAVGGATGTVQPLTYGGATTIPSDGDPRNAASVGVPFESIFDRSQVLRPAVATEKIAGRIILTNGFGPANTWAHIAAGAVASHTWGSMLNDHALTITDQVGSLSVTSAGPGGGAFALFAIAGVLPQDRMRVRWSVNFLNDPGHGTSLITYAGLFYEFVAPGGAAPTSLTGMTLLTGSVAYGPDNTTTPAGSFTKEGWLVSTGGQGTLYLAPAVYNNSSSTINPITQFEDDATILVEARRLTAFPQ